MRHFNQVELIGDVLDVVNLQAINSQNGKQTQVARTRIGVVTTGQNNQEFRASFNIEAWGDSAARLASIQPGHTVLVRGPLKNEKYNDQSGQEKWSTKVNVFLVADLGPSQVAPQGQPAQDTRAPQYGQPQGGYGGTPGGHAPQPHNAGGYGGQPQGQWGGQPQGQSRGPIPNGGVDGGGRAPGFNGFGGGNNGNFQ